MFLVILWLREASIKATSTMGPKLSTGGKTMIVAQNPRSQTLSALLEPKSMFLIA